MKRSGPPRMLSQCTLWRSVLSDGELPASDRRGIPSLNAPYGAPCFLTRTPTRTLASWSARLNAPYGAPRFLSPGGRDYACCGDAPS